MIGNGLGFIIGQLRNAAGYVRGQSIAPALGLGANGETFSVQMTIDPSGDPTPVLDVSILDIVTTRNAVNVAAATIVAANPDRKSIEFFNSHASLSAFIDFEGVEADTDSWEILPQSYYTPPAVTIGAISAISASGTPILLVNEGT